MRGKNGKPIEIRPNVSGRVVRDGNAATRPQGFSRKREAPDDAPKSSGRDTPTVRRHDVQALRQIALTPTRKMILEARVKCIRRARRRIVHAMRFATMPELTMFGEPIKRPRVGRLAKRITLGRMRQYTEAAKLLEYAQSKAAAELEGLPF